MASIEKRTRGSGTRASCASTSSRDREHEVAGASHNDEPHLLPNGTADLGAKWRKDQAQQLGPSGSAPGRAAKGWERWNGALGAGPVDYRDGVFSVPSPLRFRSQIRWC